MVKTPSPRSLCMAGLLALVILAGIAPGRAAALGNGALIFHAPSAITYGYRGLADTLQGAGADPVDTVSSWPSGTDLAATYRLVVVTPEGGADPAVAADLAPFVAAGGGVVIIAEHNMATEAGNDLATALGLAARFDGGSALMGCNGLMAAVDHPLTRDAPVISVAWGGTVTGGTVLYGTSVPMVTLEGTVVLAGDSDLFADATGLGSCSVGPDTLQFYRNLLLYLPDDSAGPPGDAGADAAAGDAGIDAGATGDGGPGATGEPCAVAGDCAGGLCAVTAEGSFCTQVCAASAECPAGFECAPAGSMNVCARTAAAGRHGGGCSTDAPVPGSVWWAGVLCAVGGLVIRRTRRRGRVTRG